MKALSARSVFAAVFTLAVSHAPRAAEDTPPPWAYPVAPPAAKAAPPAIADVELKRVPGSDVALTMAQIRDISRGPPDWYPDEHPAMPEIVAKGRAGGVLPCGYCHLPNGLGRPENAGIAGLPVEYIVQQVRDFREGRRRSAVPAMGPPANMAKLAALTNDDEVRVAAQYFAALPRTRWIRVVEAAAVPKTRVAGSMFVVEDSRVEEPIGVRIVEVPEDRARTDLRDSKSGFIAYVPPGSIAKGEAYVKSGGGKSAPCAVCHGQDLRGLGPMPGLAGRSPSYLVRSLWDLQRGSRAGAWAPLMAEAVAPLTLEDMVNIAAYAASLDP